MPLLGVRDYLLICEAAKLIAYHVERFITPAGVAEMVVSKMSSDILPHLWSYARDDELFHVVGKKSHHILRRETEIGGTDYFHLAHG